MLRSLLNQHRQKVERDTEPGGHDARDRKRADQLDLPHHLWPSHLPAVQPACLLWRIPGDSNIQWAYMGSQILQHSLVSLRRIIIFSSFLTSTGFWHWHSGEDWSDIFDIFLGSIGGVAGITLKLGMKTQTRKIHKNAIQIQILWSVVGELIMEIQIIKKIKCK